MNEMKLLSVGCRLSAWAKVGNYSDDVETLTIHILPNSEQDSTSVNRAVDQLLQKRYEFANQGSEVDARPLLLAIIKEQ